MSFRATIRTSSRTDRGFAIKVNHNERKIEVSFDANAVDSRHLDWLLQVEKRVGLGELNPQAYWGFDDLFYKAAKKLHNCFYVQAKVKKEEGKKYYHYDKVLILSKFSQEKLIIAVEEGKLLVDFDARSGHNHGTKFRLRKDCMPKLYENVEEF